jgi:hypothetical protein
VEISRSADDIGQVKDFQTLFKGAEKGMFYCQGKLPSGKMCLKNLTCLAAIVQNDGEDRYAKCPRCGKVLYFNAGWLAAKVMQAKEREKAGLAPAVGTFTGVQEEPTISEVPLPDGRKLIIARPRAAVVRAGAPRV